MSPRFSRILILWALYSLLITLLSRQSIPVTCRIYINLVQLTRSNAFCQSMKQTHSSASISRVRSVFIFSTPTASLVPFPLLNPNWSSPSTSSIFLSILLLSIFATIFAVCTCTSNYTYQFNFMLPAYRQILAQFTAPSTRLRSPGVSKSRKPTLKERKRRSLQLWYIHVRHSTRSNPSPLFSENKLLKWVTVRRY